MNTSNELTIQNHTISAKDGLYSLNDLFNASDSAEPKHQPKRWLQLVRTKALVKELKSAENRDGISVLKTSGKGGTFVCYELVYSYAMHISPAFELKVIRAFHAAAQKKLRMADLHGKAGWQQNRELGKFTRKDITDTIKLYVDYSKAQGSRGAGHYYTNITKLVNTTLCIDDRDELTEDSLHILATAEYVVEQCLLKGMSEQLPYKPVYQGLKRTMAEYSAMLEGCDG